MRRRDFVGSLLFLAGGSLAARAENFASRPAPDHTPEPPLTSAGHNVSPADSLERLDKALAAAGDYLVGRQSADGLWRSTVYAPFKQGDALTPFVLRALATLSERVPHDEDRTAHARALGTAYLKRVVSPRGQLQGEQPLTYSVYTAANSLVALGREGAAMHAAAAAHDATDAKRGWATYLRARQLTEQLGWAPDDMRYGGWSYAPEGPQKPPDGKPLSTLAEPNLSATVFAVEALRTAGGSADDLAVHYARAFIEQCQNYQPGSRPRDSDCDDGGFFFVHDDAVRNKAGRSRAAGAGERDQFASYGSATADGLRGLLTCGLPPDHRRVTAAINWIGKNFLPEKQPGAFPKDREAMRDSLYYYYQFALAGALAAADIKLLDTRHGPIDWAGWMADHLIERQREDGSWRNPAVEVREDDPLVATPLALEALVICRSVLTRARPLDRRGQAG